LIAVEGNCLTVSIRKIIDLMPATRQNILKFACDDKEFFAPTGQNIAIPHYRRRIARLRRDRGGRTLGWVQRADLAPPADPASAGRIAKRPVPGSITWVRVMPVGTLGFPVFGHVLAFPTGLRDPGRVDVVQDKIKARVL
jgi:hypothetical protein